MNTAQKIGTSVGVGAVMALSSIVPAHAAGWSVSNDSSSTFNSYAWPNRDCTGTRVSISQGRTAYGKQSIKVYNNGAYMTWYTSTGAKRSSNLTNGVCRNINASVRTYT